MKSACSLPLWLYLFITIAGVTFRVTDCARKQARSEESSEDYEVPSPSFNEETIPPEDPDYLIVGAGGSGIQTALYLKKYGYSSIILEKSSSVGSFWTKFPRFDELISVNKKVQNETQRFRYDWHSFLETDIEMWKHVTRDYFPTGEQWQEYMQKVVEHEELTIEFDTEVKRIANRNDSPCVLLMDGKTRRCAKYRVFVGTGLKERSEKYLKAIGGIPYSKMTREMADQKRVCILGNGNAAFEVAQNTYTVADRIVVLGKKPARLSSVTKYTGDVRVKFLQTLENFHGKLLDTVMHSDVKMNLQGVENLLNESQKEDVGYVIQAANFVNMQRCQVLVLCTGFRSQVPGLFLPSDQRFPKSRDWYTSVDNAAVHYVGWLMHERDFRRGAGGFLSGYRYLIRNLVNHVREQDHGVDYPRRVFTSGQGVLDHAVRRFQVSHDLVILQDGVAIRDMIVPVVVNKKGKRQKEYHYYEGVTYQFHRDLVMEHYDDIVYLYFAWGDGRSAASVFDNVFLYNDTQQLRNMYLHPMIEMADSGMVREVLEDIDMQWSNPEFGVAIKRVVRDALKKQNLDLFYPKPDCSYKPLVVNTPEDYHPFDFGIPAALEYQKFAEMAVQAVYYGGTRQVMKELRKDAQRHMPTLIFDHGKKESFHKNSNKECESKECTW